jgi:hypothetical protein
VTPHVDLAAAREYHAVVAGIMGRVVENAREDTSELDGLMSRAFELAACERHLGLPMRAWTRLGVEAGVALIACAQAPDADVAFTLGGEPVTSAGAVDESTAHTGRWEQAFYGAAILGDAAAVRALCAVPEAVPLGSSTQASSDAAHWYRVLRTLGATGAIDGELLMLALEATDPAELADELRDAALYLRVPALDVLYRIALGDAAALAASLAAAVEKHRAYWTLADEHRRDPQGYVSWPLSGLAALARARGLAVDVASEYLIRL